MLIEELLVHVAHAGFSIVCDVRCDIDVPLFASDPGPVNTTQEPKAGRAVVKQPISHNILLLPMYCQCTKAQKKTTANSHEDYK